MLSTNHRYEFGAFSLDVDRRLLLNAGRAVPLSSKVFDTLLALVANHGRVVEKRELMKLIWTDTVVEERNLAVNISSLRKALGESPDSHEYIVTIPGRGYRFVAPLREFGTVRPLEGITDEGTPQMAIFVPDGSAQEIRSSSRWKSYLYFAGLLAVAIGAFLAGRRL